MRERLMGIETEYAITALTPKGKSLPRERLLTRLFSQARKTLPYIPDTGNGMFLQNGSRLYVDTGEHPEFCTPECTNPSDVVAYILAGEKILATLASEIKSGDAEMAEVQLFRINVDYGGTFTTWGCHESYLHRAEPERVAGSIIPHLVSRVIYTGAGGFNPFLPGLEFMLSPRVAHLQRSVSDNSTQERGIFHTKNETLAKKGYNRLHILCGESLCTQTASWLKIGATALVVALIEAGVCQTRSIQLQNPVNAMRTIAADPRCSAPVDLTCGGRQNAIEIQRHYLRQAEAHLGRDFMPVWAEEVCARWNAILDQLESSPESAGTALDWAMKLALYTDRIYRRGFTWESVAQWSRAVKGAVQKTRPRNSPLAAALLSDAHSSPELQARIAELAYNLYQRRGCRDGNDLADWIQAEREILAVRTEVPALAPLLSEAGLDPRDLGGFTELRNELLEIDVRFGQIGGRGVFESLDRAGLLNHKVPGIRSCDETVLSPPSASRARVRGDFVRRNGDQSRDYICDWAQVWDRRNGRIMDLSDPFETEERWKEQPAGEGDLFLSPRRGLEELYRRIRSR